MRSAVHGVNGVLLLGTILLCGGCSFGPYNYRARTNLDYWTAIITSIRQVNAARAGGPQEQLRTVDLAIEELQSIPTSSVDSELVSFGRSTINLLESVRAYLELNGDRPLLDPTDAPGYLHDDEVTLIEQGIRTRILLASRYHMEFPRGFDRAQEFRRQPVIVTTRPGPVQDPRLVR